MTEFDYIVIGAGSAGCAAANRLSANGRYSVALLEAGGKDWSPWIHIPVGYFKTMGNPSTDWCYKTESDPGINGRAIPWPRGKVLGGCSSINGLLYVRGQAQDYDDWADAGNEGWGWNDVAPLFARSETWAGEPSKLRGTSGELQVQESPLTREIVDAWIEAAVEAGYPRADDYNGESQEGVARYQLTLAHGKRCSAATAFLKTARSRQNLHVITHATVQKLNIENGVATGVQALIKGKAVTLTASKETVVSAGAIGSPQILMLSGIGDQEELAQHGIEVQTHRPGVGKNLQDHLQARPVYKCTASTINTEISSLWSQAKVALQYAASRSGPMTMAASLGAGFLCSELSPERPDIQYHVQPWSADSPAEGPHKFSAFTASVLQLRPESAGHLKLRSGNFNDAPEIHPNYLATELDQRTIVAGLRMTRNICSQPAVSRLITAERGPGKHIDSRDEEALLDWARSNSTTIYHPTGTCKMGSDAKAVVDARLRVHGVGNLRVADASIMPQIVSGNTNAPAIMIGDKVADMLLEDNV